MCISESGISKRKLVREQSWVEKAGQTGDKVRILVYVDQRCLVLRRPEQGQEVNGMMAKIRYDCSCPLTCSRWRLLPPSFFFFLIYLFVFGFPGSSMLHGLFSSYGERGLLCSCSAGASHCGGFSRCRTRILGYSVFSSGGSWALEHSLSSCGTQAYLLLSMWNLLGPGIEPMSPTLAGRFFATEPSGKP